MKAKNWLLSPGKWADGLTLFRGIVMPICLTLVWLSNVKSFTALWIYLTIGWTTDFLDGPLAKKSKEPTRVGWKEIFYDTSFLAFATLYIIHSFAFPALLKALTLLWLSFTVFLGFRSWRRAEPHEERTHPPATPPVKLGLFRPFQASGMFAVAFSTFGYTLRTRIIPNASWPQILLIPEAWFSAVCGLVGLTRLPNALFGEQGIIRRTIDDSLTSGSDIRQLWRQFLAWFKKS